MISSSLILAIIIVESGGNPKAISPMGAHGLMQLTEIAIQEVADQYGMPNTIDPFDPATNIEYGVKLFQFYYHKAGTIKGALILFNSGYKGFYAWKSQQPWPDETKAYVQRVMAWRWELDPTFQRILPERPRPYEDLVENILDESSSF